MWTEIKTQSDIDHLLSLYGHFHDSCLRDVYITTREFVDEKLAMQFHKKLSASLLFQRQLRSPTVLELRFDDIDHFNFKPFEEGQSGYILDTTLFQLNGLFYWADNEDWQTDDNNCVWISSKKMFWRERPELIGNVQRVQGIHTPDEEQANPFN